MLHALLVKDTGTVCMGALAVSLQGRVCLGSVVLDSSFAPLHALLYLTVLLPSRHCCRPDCIVTDADE